MCVTLLLKRLGALLIWDISVFLNCIYDIELLCNWEFIHSPAGFILGNTFAIVLGLLMMFVGMTFGVGPWFSNKLVLVSSIIAFLSKPMIANPIFKWCGLYLDFSTLYLIQLIVGIFFLSIQIVLFFRRRL